MGMAPPYPVPALALQQLIDIKDKETSPKKQHSYPSSEIPHYPKSTTKASHPNFDCVFIKMDRIPPFKQEIVHPVMPHESYNDGLSLWHLLIEI